MTLQNTIKSLVEVGFYGMTNITKVCLIKSSVAESSNNYYNRNITDNWKVIKWLPIFLSNTPKEAFNKMLAAYNVFCKAKTSVAHKMHYEGAYQLERTTGLDPLM